MGGRAIHAGPHGSIGKVLKFFFVASVGERIAIVLPDGLVICPGRGMGNVLNERLWFYSMQMPRSMAVRK